MPENEGRFERGMDFFAPLPSTPHSRISLVMLRRGESGVRPYFLPCTCLSATAAMKTTTTAKRESTMLPRSRKRNPRLGEFAIADSAACPRGEPQWIRPRLICSSRRRGQSSPVAKTKFCILELFFGPRICGGTVNTTLLLAVSLLFTVTFTIFLTVTSSAAAARPFVASEGNDNTNVAAVTLVSDTVVARSSFHAVSSLGFLPLSSLVTLLCVRFRMRIENGRRSTESERMCFVSLCLDRRWLCFSTSHRITTQ